ncbi:hypothetical protein SAMN04487866_11533 [Thermoactinomyces sp. DSM 45891]|uniref:hypothetical protein n=1 Tax=Thermoactinomyces sp. DSM 45891 TaxID=1761907 RepID=UPI00091585C8|nr:hypothetical protein [Thermoactinomyces sp. DSM 45891]SFX64831.1 hypothetical protein SAMN04487866_11533 [Thermoactinomyces sp. DSM 45891]
MSRNYFKEEIKYFAVGQRDVEVSREELERVSGGNGSTDDFTSLVCDWARATINENCGMKSSLATPCKRC